jgi:hypothetical protein
VEVAVGVVEGGGGSPPLGERFVKPDSIDHQMKLHGDNPGQLNYT